MHFLSLFSELGISYKQFFNVCDLHVTYRVTLIIEVGTSCFLKVLCVHIPPVFRKSFSQHFSRRLQNKTSLKESLNTQLFKKFSWNALDTFFTTLESSLKHLWNCLGTPFKLLLDTLKLPWITLKWLLELPSIFLNTLKTSLKHLGNFPQTSIQLLLNILESHLKLH